MVKNEINELYKNYDLYLKSEGLPNQDIDDILLNQDIRLTAEQRTMILFYEQKLLDLII